MSRFAKLKKSTLKYEKDNSKRQFQKKMPKLLFRKESGTSPSALKYGET